MKRMEKGKKNEKQKKKNMVGGKAKQKSFSFSSKRDFIGFLLSSVAKL